MTEGRRSQGLGRLVSRRKVLEAGGVAGIGLTGLIVAGCGDEPPAAGPGGSDGSSTLTPTEQTPNPAATAGGVRSAGEEPLPGSLLLGRPTRTTVTLSYLSGEARELIVEHTLEGGASVGQTSPRLATGGEPLVMTLEDLAPGRRHSYRVLHRRPGENEYRAAPARNFQTARAPGSPFTFTIQADSHRDENSNQQVYRQTLANVRADSPDFHIDLGDTFMCDKFAKSNGDVVRRYVEERGWFGTISDAVPLFLVNGNHEGEAGWALNGTENNLAIWAARARLRYYLNPAPDAFYSGDPASEPFVGPRASYYAWHWGDAQFIVLDPFWFTKTKPGNRADSWQWTLGERQYRWFEQAIASSSASFKFVFLHHLVGGIDSASRGGIEAAGLWEWGGRGLDGRDAFASQRPGWRAPIHQLLVEHGASAVFHGHDHVYVKQELDGIVYQEVPQPSHQGENGAQLATEGSYRAGTVLSSSGHLRVSVRSSGALVEYVKSVAGGSTIAHAYTIKGRNG